MATNFVQRGHTVTVPAALNSGGTTSGVPVVVQSLCGVALVTTSASTKFEMGIAGVFEIQSVAAGDYDWGSPVYFDGTDVTLAATGNDFLGISLQDGTNPTTLKVLITPGAAT